MNDGSDTLKDERFVHWLQRQIDDRGWSYSELGRRGGISQSMVSKVMNYAADPGLDFFTAISVAFNLPMETVLRQAGVLPQSQDQFVDEVSDIIKNLPLDDRRYLYEMAKTHYRHVRGVPAPPAAAPRAKHDPTAK
jgi:transcriptional regulator with XRE-family HTH domain